MISIERERPRHREAAAHAAPQPFAYPLPAEFVEPDWRRLPGFREVTAEQWESAQWQRAHCVKNLAELAGTLGPFLTDDLREDIARDQIEYPAEDAIIRETFERELAKNGLKSIMPEQAYKQADYEWEYSGE